MSDEMGDLLSEDELDALLGDDEGDAAHASVPSSPRVLAHEAGAAAQAPSRSAGAIGVAPEPFDLTRPSWLDASQLRVLERLFAVTADRLSGTLSAELRASVKARLVSVEQVRCEAVFETLADPLLAYVFRQRGGRIKRWLVAFDLPAAFGMLDRILGGPGAGETPARPLTELELHLLEPVRDGVCRLVTQGLRSLMEIELGWERTESSPWLTRIADGHEPVLNVVFELGGELESGRLVLTAPIAALVSHLRTREVASADSDVHPHDGDPASARPSIERVPLELAAVLGEGRVTVRELLGLAVGDVVVLSRRAGDALELRLGSRTKYEGTVGTVGGRYGFRIRRVVAEDESQERGRKLRT